MLWKLYRLIGGKRSVDGTVVVYVTFILVTSDRLWFNAVVWVKLV